MSENTKLLRGHAGGFFDNGNPSAEVGNYDGESSVSEHNHINLFGWEFAYIFVIVIKCPADYRYITYNYENISEFPTKQVNMIVLRHGNNINIRNVSFVNNNGL
jgi:hypothetical protein